MLNSKLKTKIAQMIMVGFEGESLQSNNFIVNAIREDHIGGVILFDYNFKTKTYQKNISNPIQLKQLTNELQKIANHTLLIGIDCEGGQVNRLKENKGFQKTISANALEGLSEVDIKKYTNQMAQTLTNLGINLNFAPVLDVNLNPTNPVIGALGRSFSNDPEKIIQYAQYFYSAFRHHNIIPVYKHFPGQGSAKGDTHLGCVDVTHSWQPLELLPYQTLLRSTSDVMVMTAHIIHRTLDPSGLPASLSKNMTHELLRNHLHYDGVIITDDLQMKAIADHYSLQETIRLAINAGADILLFGNQLVDSPILPTQVIDWILDDISSNKISSHQIEKSYERIIRLKKSLSF